MAKRGATSELNDRNWDEEEEPEEAGVFAQADEDTLQHRVFKKAKRRGTGAGDSAAKPSAFSGFAGLGAASTNSNAFSGFKLKSGSGGLGAAPFSALTSSNPSGPKASAGLFSGASSTAGYGGEPSKNGDKEDSKHKASSPAYFSFLKSLNQSVLAWIKQHVEDNPYIILTPVFRDYEKYLEKHEAEHSSSTPAASASSPPVAASAGVSSPVAKNEGNDNHNTSLSVSGVTKSKDNDSPLSPTGSTPKAELPTPAEKSVDEEETKTKALSSTSSPSKGFSLGASTAFSGTGGFSFGSSTNTTKTSSTSSSTFGKSGFSFATTPATATTSPSTGFSFSTSKTATSGFSFGTASSTSSSTPATTGFTFGTAMTSKPATTSGFSFGAAVNQAGASGDTNGKTEEEEYVPPKPEVKEIKEEDALYSKRCKLFYQRDDQWVDRGVGNIHLKPVEETKTQILIRADTNLGNILLNVMLSASMPMSRQGKNNVMIVCVPNPPINAKAEAEDAASKPVLMLVRVKTGEDADELLKHLEKRKALL